MPLALPVGAASSYASPAFQQQWRQDESVIPNFWGPLATAHNGQQEPYAEAPGGQRLVQYFDKGRMELTNGTVTSGLLAREMVRGLIQTGDASFQAQLPPAIPIAGDPDNPGPTYAALGTNGRGLLNAAPQQLGNHAQAVVAPSGDVSVSGAAATGPTTFAVYDDATQHNVPQAFAEYRARAGLLTIGYGLSEPFTTTVKVAGQQRQVLVQVFERRVLTYTATNPDPFKVEMGNIGQHYYTWRYPNGAPPASVPPAATPVTATGNGLDTEEADMFARINAYRQQNGLAPLALSTTLTQAAKWMSADMAAARYFDYTDSQGRNPFRRMCDFGYCAATWKAENIAVGNGDAPATFEQWRTSAGHNANMLDPHATVIGIGRAPGGAGDPYGWYWTTDFGGASG